MMGIMRVYGWPVYESLIDVDTLGDSARVDAADAAIQTLWAFTGRHYGYTKEVARPRPSCTAAPGYMVRGSAVVLPYPVASIDKIIFAGVEQPSGEYTRHGNLLYRAGGEPWPAQNPAVSPYEEGGWAIYYTRGVKPPAGAARAAGLLAREFALSAAGDKRCQLPRRTSQIQRQGVTVQMVSPEEIYSSGATGVSEVDLWIKAHNPNGLSSRPRVLTPDRRL